MASTPQTIQTFDKFLKEFYLSSWIDQLNSMTTTWGLLRRRVVDFAGRRLVIPIRKGRNTGVGAIPTTAASGTLSTLLEAGRQQVDQALVIPKIIMGALEVAQDVIDASKNDRGAFYNAIDFEMANLVQDAAEQLDRMCYGNGNGELAFVTAAVVASANVPVSYHRPFFQGMKIDIWSTGASGAAAEATAATISSITKNTDGSGTLVLSAPVTCSDLASVTLAGARTSTDGFEMMGLDGLIDNANPPLEGGLFQGINRTGNSWWQSIVDTTATVGESFIQFNNDEVHDESNGDVQCLIANRRTRFALYQALATTNPTRLANTNLIQPGWLDGKLEDHHPDAHDFLFFDGRVPIVVDKYCPIKIDGTDRRGVMYGLDLSSVYVPLVTDWKWWDGGQGTVLRPSASRKFGLEAILYIMGNIACDAPRKNWKNETLIIG